MPRPSRTALIGSILLLVSMGTLDPNAEYLPAARTTPGNDGPVMAPVATYFAQLPLGDASKTIMASSPRAVLDKYCVACHNDRLKTAGLVLDKIDVGNVGINPDVWERVVRRLRAKTMPPAGLPRPDDTTYAAVATALESSLDREVKDNPNPGRPTIHRLNRTEYANAVRDLLSVELDARSLLPADDADLGFDNMADILSVSPALLERYMLAARQISRLAVGVVAGGPTLETYTVPKLLHQDDRLSEELPFGSRGGVAVRHYFPVDGEYSVKIRLRRQLYEYIRGLDVAQQLEVRLDGARIAAFTVGGEDHGLPPPPSYAGAIFADREWEDYAHHADARLEVRFAARAGSRLLGVSFVQSPYEVEGVLQPRATGKLLSTDESWSSPSEKREAALESVAIAGPYQAGTALVSRRQVFVCRPSQQSEARACARTILGKLGRQGFRRPLTEENLEDLLTFYDRGREQGGFEAGIQRGIESILTDPEFLFRVERDPANAAPGTVYRLSDIELASRLSFFLWSSIPDEQLLDLAARGQLSNPAVLERQVRRMLRDRRARALVENFGAQWLGLHSLRNIAPTPELFPEFDENLREAFYQETTLFLESQMRDDRSVVDLLTANSTFINERLAQHYGIRGVYGGHFRQVTYPDETRGGLLGQASILAVTSYPNRTSPVLRGKWLLDTMLGTPPPPPPPEVPALPERGEGGKPASVRQRLEQHRRNPICASCHAPMDPLGFALEQFDPIGRQRTMGEDGSVLDVSGTLVDGTQFTGLSGLKTVLVSREHQFVSTLTEKLLTYALGRGLEQFDMPAVRGIVRDARADDYRWSRIILSIVKSSPFRMRRAQS